MLFTISVQWKYYNVLSEEYKDDNRKSDCREERRDNDEFRGFALVAAVFFGEKTEGSCGWESLDECTDKNDFNREVKCAGNKISDDWGNDKLEPSDKGEAPFFQGTLKMST